MGFAWRWIFRCGIWWLISKTPFERRFFNQEDLNICLYLGKIVIWADYVIGTECSFFDEDPHLTEIGLSNLNFSCDMCLRSVRGCNIQYLASKDPIFNFILGIWCACYIFMLWNKIHWLTRVCCWISLEGIQMFLHHNHCYHCQLKFFHCTFSPLSL